jgi:hypothetical protein
MEKLKKEAIKETAQDHIIPLNYPPHLKLKWDKLWESEDRTSNYPVSLKNAEEFVAFLNECGGFKVC